MSYTLEQQAASLSSLSNLLFKAKRPYTVLDSIINEGVTKILKDFRVKSLLGEWKIVWGPTIYSAKNEKKPDPSKSCVPDNVWFVVETEQFGHKTYLIAVAGTNSKSLGQNICKQDLKVKPKDMVSLESITKVSNSNGRIALGTSIGLDIVLNHVTCVLKPTLVEWLQSLDCTSETHIITAGHSLGAAIASTLAVYIADTKHLIKGGEHIVVTTYPTAGPTVGDRAYAEHAMRTLNGRFYGKFNSLDAVARAWDRIHEVKTIYQPYDLNPKIAIKTGIRFLESLVSDNNPYCREAGWTRFTGEFNPTPKPEGKARLPFIAQVLYQHLAAYIVPLGYQEFYLLQAEIYPRPID